MAAPAGADLLAGLAAEVTRQVDADDGAEVDFLKALIRQPSPSTEEGQVGVGGVADLVWKRLSQIEGLRLSVQSVGPNSDNVIAVLPGGPGPSLLMCAHTDTVGPGDSAQWHGGDPYSAIEGVVRYLGDRQVELLIDGKSYRAGIREQIDRLWQRRAVPEREIVYGRGSYDNKASVAILAQVLAALSRSLRETGLRLGGDLIVTFQVDEEAD
ncbi:MAG: M20/M25/M40 family metallo-hydrolase, partial [Chloroflexota bacterium]